MGRARSIAELISSPWQEDGHSRCPFELFVVFATNLDPAALVDAAFLRRIQTKIKSGCGFAPSTSTGYSTVFAIKFQLQYEADVVDGLIDIIQNKLKEPLRACYPRDIVNQIRWSARYEQREPVLDREAVQTAVEAYFTTDDTGYSRRITFALGV